MARSYTGNATLTVNGNQIPIDDLTITNTVDQYNATVGVSALTSGCSTTFVDGSTSFATCYSHVTDERLVEYQDDLVIAYCVNCNARITVSRVPGGLNKLKLTTVLGLLREGHSEEVLESILDLEAQIAEEIEQLQQSARLVQAAKEQACKQLLL